jgi:hypothetical protein
LRTKRTNAVATVIKTAAPKNVARVPIAAAIAPDAANPTGIRANEPRAS